MASNYDGAHDGELNSSMDSPNPSSLASARLDNAHHQSFESDRDPMGVAEHEADAGRVAEDSIQGAFPPDGIATPDDSSGPQWAEEAEGTMAHQQKKRKGKKPSALGNVFDELKSFMLDNPQQRAERKAMKAAGLTSEPDKAQPNVPDAATGVAKPTKVSKRARLIGGKRGRAVAMMAMFVVVSLLTVVNTIMIFTRPSQSDIESHVAAAMREQGQDFPRGQAVSWADQVVIDWATWDEDNREEREVRLAQYLTSGMDSQAGWNGRGKQSVTFTSADPEPTVLDENRALVNVDYRLNDDSRRCVTVPVYAYQPEGLTGNNAQWAFGLSGNPIPRPCAPRTGAMEVDATQQEQGDLAPNDELSQALTSSFFPGFFSAWAASDANSLRQYTASGVTTIGLGGAMSSTPPPSIDNAVIMTPRNAEPVEGTVYEAIVPVTWTVAGSSAQVTATYTVPMKLMGDRWYVAGEPMPAPTSSEAQSGTPADKISPEQGTASTEESPAEETSEDGDGE